MIKLYFGHISQYPLPEDERALENILGEYRAEAVLRNKTAPGRRLSYLAGMLLKKALADEGIDIISAQFELSENGKPRLLGAGESGVPHFSVSHSGELAMAAVCDMPVGCDIQRIENKPADNCLRLAKRFFTGDEYALLYGMRGEPNTLSEKFYLIFSGKESFVKCTGEGLAKPFSSFELPQSDSEFENFQIRYFSLSDVRDELPEISFSSGYVASVCNICG